MNPSERYRVCLVEDDEIMGESLYERFALEGFSCDWCRTGSEAIHKMRAVQYHAVVSDIKLPDLSGEDLFQQMIACKVSVPPWIFITAYGTIERAIALLKLGAADYLTKPFDLDQLVAKLKLYFPAPYRELGKALPRLGLSPAMRAIEEKLALLAAQPTAILITGESGVGKEVIAQAIHQIDNGVARAAFVAVNCGGLTETLLTAELFGYEKGAFTGAMRAKRGLLEQADGGTLFLDEVGDMPLAMQVKLLRAIQDKTVTRIGSERAVPVRFRLICATHRDLRKLVESGQFREDLYYRVNVIHIRVPPLRERPEDIVWYARNFLKDLLAQKGHVVKTLSPGAERALLTHLWPGNVRELKHCIERACVLSRGSQLDAHALFDDGEANARPPNTPDRTLGQYLEECEKSYLLKELTRNDWHMGHTARAIGISRKNLWERLRRLGLTTKVLRDVEGLGT